MEGRAPYPYHRRKAAQHGEATRIRRAKDTLADVRQGIKEKRLRREEVDFEAVLAGCPEFKLACDPMEFSEIGCELPLYFQFLQWLMKQMCLYAVVGVILVLALYWPICYSEVAAPTAAPASTAAPTPAPTKPLYEYGLLGENGCPEGYIKITEASACEYASSYMEVPYKPEQNDNGEGAVCNGKSCAGARGCKHTRLGSTIAKNGKVLCALEQVAAPTAAPASTVAPTAAPAPEGYRENFWNPGPTSCEGVTTWPMAMVGSLMFWFTYREVLKHRELQKDIARTIDQDSIAPSDYAVLVRGLPKDATETEVEVFFVKRGFENRYAAGGLALEAAAAVTAAASGASASPTSTTRQERRLPTTATSASGRSTDIQIVKVMMCKDCSEVMRLRKERQKLLRKQASIEKREDAPEAQVKEVRQQIADVTQQLGKRSLVEAAASTGTAIVIFKSQAAQRAILEHWNFLNDPARKMLADLDRLCFGLLSRFGIFKSGLPKFRGKRISVKRADNPANIKWENIAVSKFDKVAGTLASWLVMVWILALDYWLAYNALQWKKEEGVQDNMVATFAISLLIAGFISLMNFLLCIVAYALAPLEKHATESGSDRAVMQKLVLALVINMCVINLLVNSSSEDWGGTSGLSQQVFSMCLSNAMAPLVRLVDPMGIIRKMRRLKWERTMTEDAPLSESDVEMYYSFYMPTVIELPVIYAKAISTFFLAMIYAPLAPVSAPLLCLAAFCSQYLADKVFVTRYARKPYTSTRANNPRAALDIVGNGMLLGSVFAGGFIGYCGSSGWGTLLMGIAIACALFLVYLLPRQYQHRLFRLQFEGERQAEAAAEASYYDAQLAWPEQDQYHTTYPLYQSCNEMPSNFDEMSLLSRKLWELRLWVAFSPQDEERQGFWGRDKEKGRPSRSPRASAILLNLASATSPR